MTISSEAKNIGSFFESPNPGIICNDTTPPWEFGTPVTYVQTGRQALAAIAHKYANEGRNILIAPDYLCESMLLGFDDSHWELKLYRVAEDLTPVSDDLIQKVTDPSRSVVLSATYFGNEPNAQYVAAVKLPRNMGVRVIEDETHRVLGPLEFNADVAIASLRKVLPVADGAYIRGAIAVTPTVEREHSGWNAMDEKHSGDIDKARQSYDAAHTALDYWLSPAAHPSSRTLRTLLTLDYEELRARRRTNAQTLRDLVRDIKDVEVVNSAEVPSHLVIRVPEAQTIQARLARSGIFCPIHWPLPKQLSGQEWRYDLLSLPIDHRYGKSDMKRIADQLQLAVY